MVATARLVQRIGVKNDDGTTTYVGEGTVILTPAVSEIGIPGAVGGPLTQKVKPIEASVDTSGNLTLGGNDYVDVTDLGSEELLNPIERTSAAWRVAYRNLKADGVAVELASFSFHPLPAAELPDGVSVNDLTLAKPITTSTGAQIVRGRTGVSVADVAVDAGDLVVTLDDATEINAGALPVGPGGSDAGVASYVAADGTATRAALNTAFVNAHVLSDSAIDATGATDTTAALQAKLTAAPDNSDVYLPAGIYQLSATLVHSKRARLFGPGRLRWVANNSSQPVVRVTTDGASLDGLTIENPAGGLALAAISVNANDVLVQGCYVSNFMHGITVHQSGEFEGCRIIGNRVTDIFGMGLGSGSTSSVGEDGGDGITIFGARAVVADNVVSAKAGRDARIGIHFEALTDQQVTHPADQDSLVTISGNVVSGPFRRPIATENTSYATISGNTVADATWWGIAVSGTCEAVSVTGNTIKWNRTAADTTGSHYSPIHTLIYILNGVKSCTVVGNIGVVRDGAAADNYVCVGGGLGNPGSVIIAENLFTREGVGAVGVGITANGAGCDYLRVAGNEIDSATTALVNAGDAADCDIVGNKLRGIAGTTTYGVLATASTAGGSISDNAISGCSHGIDRYNGAGGHVISRNRFLSCGTGIDTYNTDYALVNSNVFVTVTTPTANLGTHSVSANNLTKP